MEVGVERERVCVCVCDDAWVGMRVSARVTRVRGGAAHSCVEPSENMTRFILKRRGGLLGGVPSWLRVSSL